MYTAKAGEGDAGKANQKIAKPLPLKGKVEFFIQNQGAANEHLIVEHQFNEPGNYSYQTTRPNNATLPPIPPANQRSLNKGCSLALDMLSVPVIPDGVAQTAMPFQQRR